MELLIIKTGKEYIRIKDGECSPCGLDRASVFPMEKLVWVKEQCRTIQKGAHPRASIYKLTLSEEPL
jgi:hypothetical protein